jgi:hypothetical protein
MITKPSENNCHGQTPGFVEDHLSSEKPEQMIMFVSGEGGTGKSRLIHVITKYTQCVPGKTEGVYGSVLKTEPTGGAAYNILGHTWYSALGKTKSRDFC